MGGLSATRVTGKKGVYLAGAIEFAPDGGKAWRADMGRFLADETGLTVIDPCIHEPVEMTAEEKSNFRRWKVEEPERFLTVVRRIIDNDLKRVLDQSLFIIALWDEFAVRGTGTAGEITVAYLNRIPVYLVLGSPRSETSSWILGCATEVFDSFDELKSRLVELF